MRSLRKILEEASKFDDREIENQRQEIGEILADKKLELVDYLSDKGLTEENQNDISNAASVIPHFESQLFAIKDRLEFINTELKEFSLTVIDKKSKDYSNNLFLQIESINETLKSLSKEFIDPLSIEYQFDIRSAQDHLFNLFLEYFENEIQNSKENENFEDSYLKEILFTANPFELPAHQDFISIIIENKSKSKARSFLIDFFSDVTKYEIYKLLVALTHYSLQKFKLFKVLYNSRPIDKTSFGQRCTAALIVILLLGNTPIIIDEPEAHLDSFLISNFLVKLIKEKKRNRQIIFATHNANFVINGDAELIHILSIDENNSTIINSTTIENLDTREELIKLEGGKAAFLSRERKYII